MNDIPQKGVAAVPEAPVTASNSADVLAEAAKEKCEYRVPPRSNPGRRCVTNPVPAPRDALGVPEGMALCSCGCGVVFRPKRRWQKFVRQSHRQRSYRERVSLPLLKEVL